MKTARRLVPAALAAAAMLAGAAAHAQTPPTTTVTLYGLIDAGVETSRSGNGDLWRLVSGGAMGSRLGFTGVEDLGAGLSVVFRLEQGFTADEGLLSQGGRAFGREASVGLRDTRLGTVQAGRLPTPYYVVQGGVDAFAWMGSGGMTAITRSGTATRQLTPHLINARQDNAVGYVSPRWGGVETRLLVSAGEGSTALGRGYSASLRYGGGGLDVLVGAIRQEGAGNANGNADALVVGGSYKFGAAQVFVGQTVEKNSCVSCTGTLSRVAGVRATGASKFALTNLGLRVPLGAFTVIGQVVRVSDDTDYTVNPGNRDATWFALGGEYAFSRRTMLYGSIGSIGNRNGSQYALGSGTSQQPAAAVAAGDPRASTLVVGIRHRF